MLDTLNQLIGKIVGTTKDPVNPDKSKSKLKQEKDQWTYPQLSGVLPYRYYDDANDLFINSKSIGFLLELSPLIGANDQIVKSIDDLFRKKIPRKSPISVHFIASKCVGEIVENGLGDDTWKGNNAKKLNAITRAYYELAAIKGFKNKRDFPLYLRHYRVFLSYGKEVKTVNNQILQEVVGLRQAIRVSLESAKIDSLVCSADDFLSAIKEVVNFRQEQTRQCSSDYNVDEELNKQIVDTSLQLEVKPNYIRLGIDKDNRSGLKRQKEDSVNRREHTRIINLQLLKNPAAFALWQAPDNFANIRFQDLGIPCPFMITWAMSVEEQVSSQGEALRKDMDLSKKAASQYASLFPTTDRAAKEWKQLRQELNTNQSALCRYFYNVTLFVEDDDSVALQAELNAINAFRKNDVELGVPRYQQIRNYLATFPFMMAEGMWDDLSISGATLRSKSFNAVNLAPLVGDNSMSPQGMMLPTYRNQVAFFDMFDEAGKTNFNVAVTGTSGAGKTFLIQSVLRQVQNSGGYAWVIDMGDGYKNYCSQVGGTYLDGKNLRFNPFASIKNIELSVEGICGLLTVLASPEGNLDEVSESIMQNAVLYAWNKNGNKAKIDDVYEYLEDQKKSDRYKDSSAIFNRLCELTELLEKYCTWGIFGEYFNSDHPSLNEDTKFAVLELLSLESQPKLMAAILFSLILAIQEKMYHTPRSLKKVCIIDEGWRLLSGSNHHAARFIETGYRTVRRHKGAFITITQHIKDFMSSSEALAAWNNSATKITLLQDSQAFKAYVNENKDHFSELEQEVIRRFQPARSNWFSSVLISSGEYGSFHRLFVDPITRAMCSSTGEEFAYMQEAQKNGASADEAAYMLAKKIYTDELEELEAFIGDVA